MSQEERNPARIVRLLRCWSMPANFRALYRHDSNTLHLVNGLRFFSFAWILAFHIVLVYALLYDKHQFFALANDAPLVTWWVWNADKAVDLFFIVSGFLIGAILLREQHKSGGIDLGRFYFRRYLRLTPVYLFIALLYWWGNGSNADMLWANLLYVNNFLPMEDTAMRWTWTLAVEEQFYLALPLLLLVLARRPGGFWPCMTALLLLSFLIRAAVIAWFPDLHQNDWQTLLEDPVKSATYYEKIYDNLATRYGPFVVGVMAACACLYHKSALEHWIHQHSGRVRLIDTLALLSFFFFLFYPVHRAGFGQPGLPLWLYITVHHNLFALAVGWFLIRRMLAVSAPGPLSRLLAWRGWQPFSQLTYSMYLTHLLLLPLVIRNVHANLKLNTEWTDQVLTIATLLLSFPLGLLLSIVAALLCWLLVEKPFLNLRDQLSVQEPVAPRPSPV